MSQADRDLLYDGLAAFRLTRLIVKDDITRPLRARVIHAAYRADDDRRLGTGAFAAESDVWWEQRVAGDDEAPKLAVLATCYWCSSVWIAAGITLARWWFPRQWEPIARGLACAGAAALIAGLEKD